MNPRQVAITPRKIVELGLLGDPVHTERQKTHEIGEYMRPKCDQSGPQMGIVANKCGSKTTHRNMKVEHEQSHCHGEDPVAQGRKSLQILACDAIVMVSHTISLRFHVFPSLELPPVRGTHRLVNQ